MLHSEQGHDANGMKRQGRKRVLYRDRSRVHTVTDTMQAYANLWKETARRSTEVNCRLSREAYPKKARKEESWIQPQVFEGGCLVLWKESIHDWCHKSDIVVLSENRTLEVKEVKEGDMVEAGSGFAASTTNTWPPRCPVIKHMVCYKLKGNHIHYA
jgi:hypothetical protein